MDNNSDNNQLDTTMDKVVQQIYPLCDLDQTNSVPVSTLIEFVKPYLSDNLSELEALKKKLDPNDSNPSVTQETFHTALNEWCDKIKDSSKEQDLNMYVFFEQSTPRQSLGNNQNQIFHTSNISDIEIFESSTSETDRIIELEQQLTKITRELNSTKQQLNAAEEQNESLSSELNKTLQQLKESKQIIKQLKDNKYHNDEMVDEIDSLNHKIYNLERQLTESKKEQCQYVEKIQTLENKKLYLQNQLHLVQKQRKEAENGLIEMNELIFTKDIEITNMKETIERLKIELKEKDELVEFHKNEIEVLQNKIANLEELLDEYTMKNESIQNLMEQINNPVTPILNTSNGLQNFSNNYNNLSQSSTPNLRYRTCMQDLDINVSPIFDDMDPLSRFPLEICQPPKCMNTFEENINENAYRKQEELIEKLKNQNKEYIDKAELYKSDLTDLKKSFDELTQKYNELKEDNKILEERLNDFKNSNFNKQQIKIDRLDERIDNLKKDLLLETNRNENLLKIIDGKNETIKQLSTELENERMNFDRINSEAIQNLDGIISIVQSSNLGDEIEIIINSDKSNLQKRTRLIQELVELLINKYLELLYNYEKFDTTQDIILNQMVFPSQSDQLLQILESNENIENKFKILQENFTLNFQTTKERFYEQKQRSNRLIRKFQQILDNCLYLLKTNNQSTVVLKKLEQIRVDYWDIFTTIERCGNLEYEFRIMKCWDLIVNYIALLQDRNGRKFEAGDKETECRQIIEFNGNCKWSIFTRIFTYGFVFLFLFFLLYFMLIVFVQFKCDARTKICPLDGIIAKFIIYSPPKVY